LRDFEPQSNDNESRNSARRSVSLRQLRYFLAVYEDLHFGHAAERLRIAQPALSRAVRRLEIAIGASLLERSGRGVVPTDAGRRFAEEAAKILAAFDRAVAEARSSGGTSPPLRVGYVPYLPVDVLTRFVGAIRKNRPDLRTTVAHLPSPDQVAALRRGDLDIGIFPHSVEYADIEVHDLSDGENLAAFLDRRHPLASTDVLTPPDLRNEALVVFPRSVNPIGLELWLASVRKGGYDFAGVIEASGLTSRDLFLSVREHNAVLLGPRWYELNGDLEALGLVVRPLDPPLAMWKTVVAWSTDPAQSLAPLLAAVREAARELRGAPESDVVDDEAA